MAVLTAPSLSETVYATEETPVEVEELGEINTEDPEFDVLKANVGGVNIGVTTNVIFYTRLESVPESIKLYKDGQEVGVMHDDGISGDDYEGDMIYSLMLAIEPESMDELTYRAQHGTIKTTPITIQVFDEENYDSELLNRVLNDVQDVQNEYLEDDGYISPERANEALDAVGRKLEELSEDGDVIYVRNNGTDIFFQLSDGQWASFSPILRPEPEPNAEVEQEPDGRWKKINQTDTTKTILVNVSPEITRFELFYCPKLGAPKTVTFTAPDGSIYEAGKDVANEKFYFKTVKETSAHYSGAAEVAYDVIYISNPPAPGDWIMTIEIEQGCAFLALIPSDVPEEWDRLSVEYKTHPRGVLLWMDETTNYVFTSTNENTGMSVLLDIIAEEAGSPSPIAKQHEEYVDPYASLKTGILRGIIVIVIAGGVAFVITRNKKTAKIEQKAKAIAMANKKVRAKEKKENESLGKILDAYADDYTDDDFDMNENEVNSSEIEETVNDFSKDSLNTGENDDIPQKDTIIEKESENPAPKNAKSGNDTFSVQDFSDKGKPDIVSVTPVTQPFLTETGVPTTMRLNDEQVKTEEEQQKILPNRPVFEKTVLDDSPTDIPAPVFNNFIPPRDDKNLVQNIPVPKTVINGINPYANLKAAPSKGFF